MGNRVEYTSQDGYTGILFGESGLVVFDNNGKEVFHTGFRSANTHEELKKLVDNMPEFLVALNRMMQSMNKK